MTSMNGTVDGMGFEEVNQATSTEIVSGTNVYGTTGSFVTAKITTVNTTTVNASTVTNSEGTLKSSLLGSATTKVYGAFIQAGSFDTSAGSVGFVKFGVPYSSATSYYVNATPTGSITGYEESYVSGTRNASGVNFVGAAALRYDWIAVGL